MRELENPDYKMLVDHHPNAVMLATEGPEILYVNRMFSEVTGYEENEVLGYSPSILSSGVHSESFYQSMWRRLMDSGRWEGLIWNRRKSGETYPQWLTIYPIQHGSQRLFASVFTDVGDVTGGKEQLASMAYYDPLTELPNRSLFQEFLKARAAQRPRDEFCFAVLFIDLDFFKSVNDLHGHEFGDRVLQHVARKLKNNVRAGDMVARLSGDEFAVIVELNHKDELDLVCQRIIGAFHGPLMVDQREIYLGATIGAALYPNHGRTGAELLENADRAMYVAKLAGRDCYRLYSAKETERGLREERLSEALIVSLKTAPEEFGVVFQPQYDLNSGAVSGVEVLLRWTHPDFGSVSPAEFVPMAEQRGYIHELTRHLVRCILENLPQAPGVLRPGLVLAINISARQITDARLEGLLEPLFSRIRQLGWRPELEITETSIMDLSKACLAKLWKLRDQGIAVAIDDFGTGYSSLAYLHKLPVQVLKIDRQFIHRLCEGGAEARIIPAILGIAEALDLEVVGEGIENADQLERLRALGCARGQGYLMARPEPWDAIKSLLIDENH